MTTIWRICPTRIKDIILQQLPRCRVKQGLKQRLLTGTGKVETLGNSSALHSRASLRPWSHNWFCACNRRSPESLLPGRSGNTSPKGWITRFRARPATCLGASHTFSCTAPQTLLSLGYSCLRYQLQLRKQWWILPIFLPKISKTSCAFHVHHSKAPLLLLPWPFLFEIGQVVATVERHRSHGASNSHLPHLKEKRLGMGFERSRRFNDITHIYIYTYIYNMYMYIYIYIYM